jgi:hypothetical protein
VENDTQSENVTDDDDGIAPENQHPIIRNAPLLETAKVPEFSEKME